MTNSQAPTPQQATDAPERVEHPDGPGRSSGAVVMSRRHLLLAGGGAVLAACTSQVSKGGSSATATSAGAPSATSAAVDTANGAVQYNPLWIPPMLEGPTFDLSLAPSTAALVDGTASTTISYNGSPMWGPTLVMHKGDTVTVNVTNNLSEDTTTHWHGAHLPAVMDGGPHQVVQPGATWSPTWTVKNQAATYWYHPHAHEKTWKQLNQGAGGFIIVKDDEEAALDLPRTYGVDDFPLVLTSRTFDASGQIVTSTIYGDVLLANGTARAELSVPAQMVRFRVLNAEVERAYTLGFADGRTFWVIGTDGGLVETPVAVTRVVMAPGERYEIVVDLTGDVVDSTVMLQSFNGGYTLGYPGGEPATSGAFGSLLNNKTFDVLRLKVTAATAEAVTTLPTSLVRNTLWTAADATNQRTIAITDKGPGTIFTFDNPNLPFSMDRIDQTVVLDTVEAWRITNDAVFGHAFHMHDVQFAIVDRSSGEVADYEKGWKDTLFIQVNEQVTFVAKFDDYASADHPYMYHCHMANHEDEGLMGQFLVVDHTASLVGG